MHFGNFGAARHI